MGTLSVNVSTLTLAGIVLILCITFYWVLFEKSQKPGWAVLIPLYNIFTISKIAKIKFSWIILTIIAVCTFFALLPKTFSIYTQMLLGSPQIVVTPGVESYMGFSSVALIIIAVWLIMIALGLAKRFGQNIVFALGLLLLSPVFICVLGFNDKIKYSNDE